MRVKPHRKSRDGSPFRHDRDWVYGCTTKVRYSTKDAALRGLASTRSYSLNPALAVYKCRNCGHWHVGTTR